MNTKVFISWSGEKSQKIGKALNDLLPSVLQFVRPYYSPDDIEKGSKWTSEITKALSECDVGIICLTRDNLDKAWILFESGAISKKFGDSNVCTALFGLEPSEVTAPLSLFQTTKFKKEDFLKLIHTINKCNKDNALQDKVVDQVFEKWWPDLEKQIEEILSQSDGPKQEVRDQREILEEILELSRRNFVRQRHSLETSLIPPRKFAEDFSMIVDELTDIGLKSDSFEIIEKCETIAKMFRLIYRPSDSQSRKIIEELLERTQGRLTAVSPF